MRVECTQCGAVGNVKSQDPNKLFRCPKCGGAMQVAVAEGAPATPAAAPVSRGRSRLQERLDQAKGRRGKRRKKLPVTAIAISIFVLMVAAFGGYLAYVGGQAPSGGAKALGLLPSTAVYAASVEDVDALPADLAKLTGANPHKLQEAVNAHQSRFEANLAARLGVSKAETAAVVRQIKAIGWGGVPVEGPIPAQVMLLVLKDTAPVDALLGRSIKVAGDAPGRRIYKGRDFVAKFGKTLVLSTDRGVLEAMAQSEQKRGARSLAVSKSFRAARAKYAGKGRAWFYAPDSALAAAKKAAGAIPGPAAAAAALLDQQKGVSAVGYVAIDDPVMVIRVDVAPPNDRSLYDAARRLEPRALVSPEYMPDRAMVAVALSLGDPALTYESLIGALDGRLKEAMGLSVKALIAGFESQGERLSIGSELMPLLAGEIGVFVAPVTMAGPVGRMTVPMGAAIVPVKDASLAGPVIQRLVKKITGADPKLTPHSGVNMWMGQGGASVVYAFLDNILVLSMAPEGVLLAKKAQESGLSVAKDKLTRKAMDQMPAKSSVLVVVREAETKKKLRKATGTAAGVLSVALGKDGADVTVAIPCLAEALIAGAPDDVAGRQPDHSPLTLERRCRKNIQDLHALCVTYMQERGGGTQYPGSFADLVRKGYITWKRNKHLLVRPGDTHPQPAKGIQATSYQMAFDVVKHTFTKDTAGELPMVWERDAVGPHNGKRFVVYFNGAVKLEEVSVDALVKRLQDALPKPKPPDDPGLPDLPDAPDAP